MLIKTRGIVLRSLKYSETSFILDIYTEEKGLRSYIISGVRSQRAKVGAALMQITTLVDMVAYFREDKDMSRIKEIKAAYNYQSIPFDVFKGAVGIFMAEVAQKCIREREENTALFRYLYDSFVLLDQTDQHIGSIPIQFMLELSGYLGFYPANQYGEDTPFFDLQEGQFLAEAPTHMHFLQPEMSQLLGQFLVSNLEQSHTIRMPKEKRRALLREVLQYYRLHIEGFAKINAHEVLENIF